MKREFRYSASSFRNLSHNVAHEFAARHALALYRRRAVYSFIPKCACSTMRYTLAVDNGCISDSSEVGWIDRNNETFRAQLDELLACDYAFTIMRCPYRRIASVFLDKVVKGDLRVRPLVMKGWIPKLVRGVTGRNTAMSWWSRRIQSLSFADFIASLCQGQALTLDHHWVPQTQFLVYKSYDDVFCLERFASAKQTLREKIGLEVVDARELVKHDTSHYEKLQGNGYSQCSAAEIAELKQQGQIPSYESLYDDEVKAMVDRLYAADIAFYTEQFGKDGLLFN